MKLTLEWERMIMRLDKGHEHIDCELVSDIPGLLGVIILTA